MTLQEKIEKDFLVSYRTREKDTVAVLRMLKSAIKNREIDKKEPLTDEEVLQTIRGEIKKRKESIENYQTGNRPDLVAIEQKEIEILSVYLPAELSEVELEQKILTVLADLGGKEKVNYGQLMGASMKALNGQVDGKRVGEAVKKILS